jgi:predicted RNA-binding protein (virulence factor B family)
MTLKSPRILEPSIDSRRDQSAPVAGVIQRVRPENKKGRAISVKGGFFKGQKVALRISSQTEMGFLADINGTHKGILYKNEVFQPLKIGQEIDGFIKKVRDDKKIDLCLQRPGYKSVDAVSRKIMDELQQQGGFIRVTDESRPRLIADLFGISKKSFKKAIGNLYKKRLITLEENGIRLRGKKVKSPVSSSNVPARRPAAARLRS